jgi:hypothetical protein
MAGVKKSKVSRRVHVVELKESITKRGVRRKVVDAMQFNKTSGLSTDHSYRQSCSSIDAMTEQVHMDIICNDNYIQIPHKN